VDKLDYQILEALKENGRSTASEISRRVSLSVPAVTERIRKMEQAQIIEKYTVKINQKEAGYRLLAFIFVTISAVKHIEPFQRQIIQEPAVLECHHIAGSYDYILKVLVKDTEDLENFLGHILKQVEGVAGTNTIICLSTAKEEINRQEILP